MLIIECIFSLTLDIFIEYIYDFDIDKINKNIELLIPYIIKIINSIVSIVIDGFIGFLISIFVIFILYLLFLMFSKTINYIRRIKILDWMKKQEDKIIITTIIMTILI
jgi:hypothetical protein